MLDIENFETIKIVDNYNNVFNNYGRVDFILNDKDIEDLKNGKIINASIEQEYAMTLKYIDTDSCVGINNFITENKILERLSKEEIKRLINKHFGKGE
jgi:hypothetical protein